MVQKWVIFDPKKGSFLVIFDPFFGHFWPIFDPLRNHFLAIISLKVGGKSVQKSAKSGPQKWPQKSLIFDHFWPIFRHFWPFLTHFWPIFGPLFGLYPLRIREITPKKGVPKWGSKMSHFGSFWPLFDPILTPFLDPILGHLIREIL